MLDNMSSTIPDQKLLSTGYFSKLDFDTNHKIKFGLYMQGNSLIWFILWLQKQQCLNSTWRKLKEKNYTREVKAGLPKI